jgi:hypothetical protein
VGHHSKAGGRGELRVGCTDGKRYCVSQSVPQHRGLTAASGGIAWKTSVRQEGELRVGCTGGKRYGASQSVPQHRSLTAASGGTAWKTSVRQEGGGAASRVHRWEALLCEPVCPATQKPHCCIRPVIRSPATDVNATDVPIFEAHFEDNFPWR